jgi:hypothetical protein
MNRNSARIFELEVGLTTLPTQHHTKRNDEQSSAEHPLIQIAFLLLSFYQTERTNYPAEGR